MCGFFRLLVRWVRGGGVRVYLGVGGGRWSFTGVRTLCGWVLLWVGLRRELCVIFAAAVLCTVCSPGGVGKIVY